MIESSVKVNRQDIKGLSQESRIKDIIEMLLQNQSSIDSISIQIMDDINGKASPTGSSQTPSIRPRKNIPATTFHELLSSSRLGSQSCDYCKECGCQLNSLKIHLCPSYSRYAYFLHENDRGRAILICKFCRKRGQSPLSSKHRQKNRRCKSKSKKMNFEELLDQRRESNISGDCNRNREVSLHVYIWLGLYPLYFRSLQQRVQLEKLEQYDEFRALGPASIGPYEQRLTQLNYQKHWLRVWQNVRQLLSQTQYRKDLSQMKQAIRQLSQQPYIERPENQQYYFLKDFKPIVNADDVFAYFSKDERFLNPKYDKTELLKSVLLFAAFCQRTEARRFSACLLDAQGILDFQKYDYSHHPYNKLNYETVLKYCRHGKARYVDQEAAKLLNPYLHRKVKAGFYYYEQLAIFPPDILQKVTWEFQGPCESNIFQIQPSKKKEMKSFLKYFTDRKYAAEVAWSCLGKHKIKDIVPVMLLSNKALHISICKLIQITYLKAQKIGKNSKLALQGTPKIMKSDYQYLLGWDRKIHLKQQMEEALPRQVIIRKSQRQTKNIQYAPQQDLSHLSFSDQDYSSASLKMHLLGEQRVKQLIQQQNLQKNQNQSDKFISPYLGQKYQQVASVDKDKEKDVDENQEIDEEPIQPDSFDDYQSFSTVQNVAKLINSRKTSYICQSCREHKFYRDKFEFDQRPRCLCVHSSQMQLQTNFDRPVWNYKLPSQRHKLADLSLRKAPRVVSNNIESTVIQSGYMYAPSPIYHNKVNKRFMTFSLCPIRSHVEDIIVHSRKHMSTAPFQIRKSSIQNAGLGVFAKVNLKKGTIITEYLGQIMLLSEYPRVEAVQNSMVSLYVFQEDQIVVSPVRYCNLGRFLNSNINPNCQASVCFLQKQQELTLILFSRRAIQEGQQLTWDYGPSYQI